MSERITMPQLGETVTEGTILRWLVKVGDEVAFQPDSEYEFTVDGVLLYRIMSKFITVKL